MPRFAYDAIDTTGNAVEGVTKADTIGAARALLVDQEPVPDEDRGTRWHARLRAHQGEGEEEGADALHASAGGVREGRYPDHRRARDRSATRPRTWPCGARITHMVDDLRNGGTFVRAPRRSTRRRSRRTTSASSGLGRAHRPARRDAGEPRRVPRARDRHARQGRVGTVVSRWSSWCWPSFTVAVLAGLRAAAVQAAVRGARRRAAAARPG